MLHIPLYKPPHDEEPFISEQLNFGIHWTLPLSNLVLRVLSDPSLQSERERWVGERTWERGWPSS